MWQNVNDLHQVDRCLLAIELYQRETCKNLLGREIYNMVTNMPTFCHGITKKYSYMWKLFLLGNHTRACMCIVCVLVLCEVFRFVLPPSVSLQKGLTLWDGGSINQAFETF